MEQPATIEPYDLTAADVSALVGAHERTVRAWADSRRISHIVLPGGQRRFRRSDVEAFLAAARRDRAAS